MGPRVRAGRAQLGLKVLLPTDLDTSSRVWCLSARWAGLRRTMEGNHGAPGRDGDEAHEPPMEKRVTPEPKRVRTAEEVSRRLLRTASLEGLATAAASVHQGLC
jgi:hypothetical protein